MTSVPQLLPHISHSLSFTPFDTKWIPCAPKFVTCGTTARGSGRIEILEIEGNKLNCVSSHEAKEGFKCCTFGASSFEHRELAVGGYDGSLAVFGIERFSEPVFHVAAHKGLINSIDGCGGLNIGGGAPELATGGRDGCVRIWDIRVNTPVAALEPAETAQSRDCWAVAFGNSFNDSDRVVACGYDNGDLKFLCLRTNKLLWETNVGNGIVGIQFDRKDIEMNKCVVTTLESKFRVYDMRTLHPQEGYAFLSESSSHKSTVWNVKHLPQNRDVFVTTGGNGSVNLWQYKYPEQRRLKDSEGHDRGVMGQLINLNSKKFSDQPVVAWDWNMDKMGLACMAALDQSVKVGIVTKLNTI